MRENGWGGRDRTYECRNQNPVPYHLATPQRKICADFRDLPRGPLSVPQCPNQDPVPKGYANANSGWRASVRTTRPANPDGNTVNALRASSSPANAANTQ